jgi:hydrogenase maturation protein HypF
MGAELTKTAARPGNRLRITVRGAVQGVGFRPFVFRLATELGLRGQVYNSSQGLFIEVEGLRPALGSFLARLETERPPRSFIQSLEAAWLDPAGYNQFEIRPSQTSEGDTTLVLPDVATCPDCLREIFDPGNRRYFYPFTNCTNCGPRFSIITALPYDRPNTSMGRFSMCPACQAEYENPLDRRFHAQPNACEKCGPRLALWNNVGTAVSPSEATARSILQQAAEAIRQGRILALKGLGGFQLLAAAHLDATVGRLRELKHREEKPFALMAPSLESIELFCEISPVERRLIRAPEAPIVLLGRKHGPLANLGSIAQAVAPGNPTLGVMLPYTPLHHLLLSLLAFPVVATSGNLRDEPICTDEQEAVERLGGLSDLFLVHDRPIVRHVDDSIVRIVADREMVLRRARGYAPLPISSPYSVNSRERVLAVGAHLKNSVALASGPHAFISQHIGDLETDQAYSAFKRVIADFERLFAVQPTTVSADTHPDYLSTRFAWELNGVGTTTPKVLGNPQDPTAPRLLSVQHHLAHVLSCLAENEISEPALGVAWDGTGHGLDGTIWGGEFFLVSRDHWCRFAHFRPFRLPGGEKAIKEPRRAALGLLFEVFGEQVFDMDVAAVKRFSGAELKSLRTMLGRGLNSPLTTSVGRLFDAVSSLIDLRHQVRFEGQAAMELEFALGATDTEETYPVTLLPGKTHEGHPLSEQTWILDWADLVRALVNDLDQHVPQSRISARFHNTLVRGISLIAHRAGQAKVALSGGCFQNRYLIERAIEVLRREGFQPYWHQRVPTNDGGICLGQVEAVRRGFMSPGEERERLHPRV